MIPIRDNVPSRDYPLVNILLIWANFIVFVIELSQPDLEQFLANWGMVPARLSHEGLSAGVLATFFTSLFLHGGLAHVIGNMWFLYIFGDNVEDRLGHFRYLWFYLACGLAGGLAHLGANLGSTVPAVGASGAIAGVLGAYFLLFPGAKVAALVWFVWIIEVVEIPAVTFLGVWFIFQLMAGVVSLPFAEQGGGVAWWAHVGGFVAGLFLVKLLCRRRREACRYPYDFIPSRW
jgi:membrane associated rhomboid family serine protease